MSNVVFLAALESEFLPESFSNFKVFYTGVGKINASYWTTKIIDEFKPKLIINIGTAGVLKEELLGKVHEVSSVVERDMMCMPLSERGVTPFDTIDSEININKSGLKVATGDSFVTTSDYWFTEKKIDLVDMELFAIAKVCLKEGVDCKAFKYASDLADSNAGNDWKSSLVESRFELQLKVNKLLERKVYA